jgi:predicted DNA-binding ribbon-helix-helix protein
MGDNYEQIEIEISEEHFLILAKMAHEKNITLNQLITNILLEYIEKETQTTKETPNV